MPIVAYANTQYLMLTPAFSPPKADFSGPCPDRLQGASGMKLRGAHFKCCSMPNAQCPMPNAKCQMPSYYT
jgi:hypothetical protein